MNIGQIGSYRRRQFQPKREEQGNAFSVRVIEERLGNGISENRMKIKLTNKESSRD